MRINRAAIKHNAKLTILSTRPSPLMIGILFVLTAYVIQLFTTRLNGSYQMMIEMLDQYAQGVYDYVPVLPPVSTGAYLIIFALEIMLYVIGAGFTMYCMKICRGEEAGYKNLFDGFTIFFKLIGLQLLMGLFVFLWSLLLIIPGIIAAYRYSLALYIMVDNPELGVLECLKRSKEMTRGRKGEIFVLGLSFLGWNLLAMFPPASIWVTPYRMITYVNYYLAVKGLEEAA